MEHRTFMNTLLHASQVSVGYAGSPLIADVDLRLAAGELVALIGANGTGKSTLLRTLAGIQPSLGGRIEYGTTDGSIDAAQRARRVAIVLTGRPRTGTLNVEALVALGRLPWTGRFGGLCAEDRRIIEEAMERCRITAIRSRSIDSLSDGECQQAMIARALAQATPVLLLDEPTAHLDLTNRVRIMRLLRELARDVGKAVLCSTHDVHLALDLSDRLLLLRRDRSLWHGAPRDAMASGVLAAEFNDRHVRFDPAASAFRAV
jgi:iron complex transport system ATP-binding protein